jgi:hypothetical protein
MGYWSKHPMGGDMPLDCEANYVFEQIFTKEELDSDIEMNEENYSPRLIKHLSTIEMNDPDYAFIIPFRVMEFEIQIEDPELRAKIKEMIGDGGAQERGYNVPEPGDVDFPTAQNGYNSFQSPFDYAQQLRDIWDDVMTGVKPFGEAQPDHGLFAVLANHTGSGMLNTN